MVFFTCDGCGEALKKNQVQKHTFKCRSHSFSCHDCQKVFDRDTYQEHTKCITENEKYGGANYVSKEHKGDVKQNSWLELVTQAIANVREPKLKSVLEHIQGQENIPRKEKKFINFLMNSGKVRSAELATRAWRSISDEAAKLKSGSDNTPTATTATIEAEADESGPERNDKRAGKRRKVFTADDECDNAGDEGGEGNGTAEEGNGTAEDEGEERESKRASGKSKKKRRRIEERQEEAASSE